MQKHTKIYMEYFGYGEQDYIPCELCSERAVDVHHIDNRAMGGSALKDYIENLAALCRRCHTKAEADPQLNARLADIHESRVKVFAYLKNNKKA